MGRLAKAMVALFSNLILLSGSALAAPELAPNGIITSKSSFRDAGVDLQRTRELLEQQKIAEELAKNSPKEDNKGKKDSKDTKLQEKKGNTFILKKLETDDSNVLTQKEIRSLCEPYEGKEVDAKELYKLVDAINDLYVKKGHLTCRAYFKQQVVKDGVVHISLLEGVNGRISLTNNRYTKASYIKKHLPLDEGKVMQIDRLNNALLHFNATHDAQLRVVLKPGEQYGTTDYELQVYEPQQFSTNVFTDNAGSYSSGIYRQGAFFNVRSLTGERDALTLGLVHSKGSENFVCNYNHPLGRSGTKLNLGYNTNSVEVLEGSVAHKVKGHANAFSIGVSQPWITGTKLRSEASLEYNHQISRTDFMHVFKLVDDRIDDVTAAFSMTNYGKSSVFYQKHGYTRGYHDNNIYTPVKGNFGYYKFNGVYQKGYQHGQLLSAIGEAQWAGGEALPSARQFFIGGMNSVRGYRESLLAGESGYFVNLEYQVPLGSKKTKAYVFYDYGSVHGKSAFEDHILQSTGLGFRSSFTKRIMATISLGVPLIKNVNVEEIGKVRTHFLLSGQF